MTILSSMLVRIALIRNPLPQRSGSRPGPARSRWRMGGVLLGCLLVLVLPVAASAQNEPVSVEGRNGMVVTVSAPASEVGREILERGGTAVDAAVAVAFALAVTYPSAGNIGGGGFMMVHPSDGRPPVCVEYRETAPAASTPDMFTLGETHLSHKVVGVPGTVRGLELAHHQYGRLEWRDLVLPSVGLARDGFELDAATARSLNGILESDSTAPFTEMIRVYGKPDGGEWEAGDRLVLPDLARTLERIAENGPDAFYRGPIAEQIVAEMQAGGGRITLEDLKNYRANLREPIRIRFQEHDVYGPPPPSSGGITLGLMLTMIEQFPLREQGRWSPETVHVMIEAMRRAYLERARHLGDSDFVPIPDHLTDRDFAVQLAKAIDLERATPSDELADDITLADEAPSTTHFSVVDGTGMAVSNTYTLQQSYGSRIVVRGAGFLLNNEMGDFNWKPGHTDRKGRIGTEANVIAPGKRMLSSQTPVIVAREREPVLVTGSPGGRTIINTSFCVVTNVLLFGMDLPEAVGAPRMHHQWLPDQVRLEQGDQDRFQELVEDLKRRGHDVGTTRRQGDAHSIRRDPESGTLQGVPDPRISGAASGY
jgi:gamma-glutamyltranspeptidase / glutathione hydrolase